MIPQHMQYSIVYVSFLHWLQKQVLMAKGSPLNLLQSIFPLLPQKKKKKKKERKKEKKNPWMDFPLHGC